MSRAVFAVLLIMSAGSGAVQADAQGTAQPPAAVDGAQAPAAPLSPLGRRARDPFAKTFGPSSGVLPLATAADARATARTAVTDVRIVCGTTVIGAGPELDPLMPKSLADGAPRAATRRVPPPACAP